MRKKSKRVVGVVRNPLMSMQRLDDSQITDISLSYHTALNALDIGMGDDKSLWTLAAMLEMAHIGVERSKSLDESGKDEAMRALRDAFTGLIAAVNRGYSEQHKGKFSLDGDTRKLMREILNAHDEQVSEATQMEVSAWIKECKRRAKNGGNFKVSV